MASIFSTFFLLCFCLFLCASKSFSIASLMSFPVSTLWLLFLAYIYAYFLVSGFISLYRSLIKSRVTPLTFDNLSLASSMPEYKSTSWFIVLRLIMRNITSTFSSFLMVQSFFRSATWPVIRLKEVSNLDCIACVFRFTLLNEWKDWDNVLIVTSFSELRNSLSLFALPYFSFNFEVLDLIPLAFRLFVLIFVCLF